MTKQYTSEKAKRIMEISEEIQQIVDDNKDNPLIQQMCGYLVEIANMGTKDNSEIIQANNRYIQLNEDMDGLMYLIHSYLESKGQIGEFQGFTESQLAECNSMLH